MDEMQTELAELSLAGTPPERALPGTPQGLPEGLAELAAQRPDNDWSALPNSLLGEVFRRLLEQLITVEEIVRAWQDLALVCKGWQQALHQSTPLCLELTKPQHLSAGARRWLSAIPMEVLVLARTMSPPPGADCLLLAAEGFQAHSASVLRSLMHASPNVAPLLHNFAKLKQVALYCGDEAERARHIDASVFHQLPKLNCLTVAGFWGSLDTDQLPTRLKHLALSNYNEGFSLEMTLPPGLKHLELLSLRADGVVLDWKDVCQKCEEIHVAAEAVVLGVGAESVPTLIREYGLDNLQAQLYRRVGRAITEGERFADATLAFFNLMLASGPLDQGVLPIDADDFLQTLRDDLLPVGVDVNPALEVYAEFVRDVPSPEACFVLELVKQEAGKPKSLHFTTPVTDSEVRLLTTQPVWRISWCDDPRAPRILADPQFLAHSANTLTDLLSISLVPELDLRPFTKLLSVLGMLRCEDAQLATVLRRMPRSLESLCITAEGSPEPRDFNAELVRHLRALREISLYGHRRHNLSRLRPAVNMVRIMNPVVANNEVIGTGANYQWPDLTGEPAHDGGTDSGTDSGDGSECGSEASADSWGSASSELGAGGSGGGSPLEAGSGQPGAAAQAEAAAAAEQERQQLGGGAAAGGAAGSGPAGAAGAAGQEDQEGEPSSSSSSSSSDDGSHYEDAEHGHGHRHGAGMEDERHTKQACQDAFCPLHSGKSFLQISLTDERQRSVIDFSALLAIGFKMVTITLSAEHADARCTLQHEGSWKTVLAALESSSVEVLELNCQAAAMSFRSSSLLHRLTEVPVEAAMRYVADNYADTWQVKSWNGNTAADGVLEGSRGYALMRRSVMEAQAAARGVGAAAAGGAAD